MVAKRVDANQREIVNGMRDAGFSVFVLSSVGNDFPDIIVGAFGKNFLMEIKNGTKPPSARKLRPGQQKFANEWKGQVSTVYSLEDAFCVLDTSRT